MRAVNGDADLLLGIGSAPEGVISAVAVKGLKGVFQGRMWSVSYTHLTLPPKRIE